MMKRRQSDCGSRPRQERQVRVRSHRSMRVWASRMIGAALLLSLGCSQQKPPPLTPTGPPIEWPQAPDTARLRFLGELKGSADLNPQKSAGQLLDELFHGPAGVSPLVSPYAVAVHADG